jgi:beta-lactamase class A
MLIPSFLFTSSIVLDPVATSLVQSQLVQSQPVQSRLVQPSLVQPQPVLARTMQARTMQISPKAALERLLTAPSPQAEWFNEAFLAQVPLPQIQQILARLQQSFGAYQSVQAEGENYIIVFTRGKVVATIDVNESGQITTLLLTPVVEAIAPTAAIEQLRALPGKTNLVIVEGNSELAAYNADQPLAVGSAFKLAVLATLQRQIETGDRTWRDVVKLRPQDRSLPSGILQDWYDGAQLTVETVATLMISQSDNTATDVLMNLVGQEAIAPLASRNQPFLTTREFFALKNPQNEAFLKRYRSGTVQQRRQVLRELATAPLPDASLFAEQPVALDVEWFFTPRELCGLMQKVEDLPLMSVNPGGGLVDPSQWQKVSYKGGSEPGVLNLTTSLKAENGKTYCVSATWNNAANPLDETGFYTLYSGIIKGLQGQPE